MGIVSAMVFEKAASVEVERSELTVLASLAMVKEDRQVVLD